MWRELNILDFVEVFLNKRGGEGETLENGTVYDSNGCCVFDFVVIRLEKKKPLQLDDF